MARLKNPLVGGKSPVLWGYRCPKHHIHTAAEIETGNAQHPLKCPTCGVGHTMLCLWSKPTKEWMRSVGWLDD